MPDEWWVEGHAAAETRDTFLVQSAEDRTCIVVSDASRRWYVHPVPGDEMPAAQAAGALPAILGAVAGYIGTIRDPARRTPLAQSIHREIEALAGMGQAPPPGVNAVGAAAASFPQRPPRAPVLPPGTGTRTGGVRAWKPIGPRGQGHAPGAPA